jgi:hypothetical protein
MIDFNPSHMTRSVAVQAIHEALDAVAPPVEKRRDYVGASAIGSPCERRVQYEFLGTPHDEGWRYSARTLRIFQRGHIMESAAAIWLSDAGFRLTQSAKHGGPIGFSVAGGQYKGHVDRVITHGPEGIEYPCVWEHKAVGAKSWKAIESKGLAKAKPEYADQISQYQSYLDLTAPALFQATNTDTMEIYLELVPFDKARAQAASDRAVAIIKDSRAGSLRPRPTEDPDFYACKDCPFRVRCWS